MEYLKVAGLENVRGQVNKNEVRKVGRGHIQEFDL